MSKFELRNIDEEDIEDIILQIEKSLDTTFPNDAFKDVLTFGDLVTTIENNINSDHSESCTSQQAFYKVRVALKEMNQNGEITPDLPLNSVFPIQNRRSKVSEFIQHLGVEIILLKPNGFIYNSSMLALLVGVILLFPYPLIGVAVIGLSILSLRVADKLGTEFRVNNVKELCKLLKNENYSSSRSSSTINRNEIWSIVESYFKPYDLSGKLTANTKFGWAK